MNGAQVWVRCTIYCNTICKIRRCDTVEKISTSSCVIPSFLKVMITWRHFLAFVSLILVCWLNLPFPWNRMLSASSSVRCSMLQTGEGRGVSFVGNLSYVWSLPYSFWDCSSSSCYPTRLGTVQLSRYNNLCSPTPELGWSSRLHI